MRCLCKMRASKYQLDKNRDRSSTNGKVLMRSVVFVRVDLQHKENFASSAFISILRGCWAHQDDLLCSKSLPTLRLLLSHRQATDAEAGQTRGDAYVTAASGCYTTSMFTRTKRPVRTHTHTHIAHHRWKQ